LSSSPKSRIDFDEAFVDGLNDILERKDGSIAEICELKTLIKEGRERQNKLERE
jgi:hypothetical protein